MSNNLRKLLRLITEYQQQGCSSNQLTKFLGVDRSTLRRWRSGKQEPRKSIRHRILRMLGHDPEQVESAAELEGSVIGRKLTLEQILDGISVAYKAGDGVEAFIFYGYLLTLILALFHANLVPLALAMNSGCPSADLDNFESLKVSTGVTLKVDMKEGKVVWWICYHNARKSAEVSVTRRTLFDAIEAMRIGAAELPTKPLNHV